MAFSFREPLASIRRIIRRPPVEEVVLPAPPPVPEPVVPRAFDPVLDHPLVLFLSMSTSNICNFRCKFCHIWMNENPSNELTTAQRIDVIDQFARLSGPGGCVFPAGGEVTMDLDEIFALAGACRDRGLQCRIATNGSALVSPEIADRFVLSGLSSVTISLDSHHRELHDYTRGLKCFDETVNAIRLLVEARNRHAAPMLVGAAAVIFDRNLDDLEDYIDYCRALNVDFADFSLLGRTFANHAKHGDPFFEKHFWWTPEAKQHAKETVERVIRHRAATPGVIGRSLDDIPWMHGYIDDPDFVLSDAVCGSHERNLVVDTTGQVSLCFNASMIFEEPHIGNVKESTLFELWTGTKTEEYRSVMDECRLNCGALGCHRKMDAKEWAPAAGIVAHSPSPDGSAAGSHGLPAAGSV